MRNLLNEQPDPDFWQCWRSQATDVMHSWDDHLLRNPSCPDIWLRNWGERGLNEELRAAGEPPIPFGRSAIAQELFVSEDPRVCPACVKHQKAVGDLLRVSRPVINCMLVKLSQTQKRRARLDLATLAAIRAAELFAVIVGRL